MVKLCSYPNCTRPKGNGPLCIMHYSRKRRGSDMDKSPKDSCKGEVCIVDGCLNPQRAKGMCNMHYLRKWSGIPLDAPIQDRDHHPLSDICSVVGCFFPRIAKGLCRLHYQRVQTGREIKPRERHGMSCLAEYTVWEGMIQRCTNAKSPEYSNYGGRGIGIHPSWRSFTEFISDMGLRPTRKHTLERSDNSKDYGPDNCVWALPLQQNYNKRNNVIITAFGVTGCIAFVARHFGLIPNTIQCRLKRGMTPEEAISA